MRFIEIKEGFSIAIDKIEAIERTGEFTSKVHTHFNAHEANFPYITLLRLLEEPEPRKEKVMNKLEAVLDQSQHFAG